MCGKIKVLQPYLLPYSYSLFEPNSRTLAEYGVRLEKAILRDSELLSEVNNAFCNSHQEVGKEFFDDSEGEEVEEAHTSSFITTFQGGEEEGEEEEEVAK